MCSVLETGIISTASKCELFFGVGPLRKRRFLRHVLQHVSHFAVYLLMLLPCSVAGIHFRCSRSLVVQGSIRQIEPTRLLLRRLCRTKYQLIGPGDENQFGVHKLQQATWMRLATSGRCRSHGRIADLGTDSSESGQAIYRKQHGRWSRPNPYVSSASSNSHEPPQQEFA
jgi:hypothetical protein